MHLAGKSAEKPAGSSDQGVAILCGAADVVNWIVRSNQSRSCWI